MDFPTVTAGTTGICRPCTRRKNIFPGFSDTSGIWKRRHKFCTSLLRCRSCIHRRFCWRLRQLPSFLQLRPKWLQQHRQWLFRFQEKSPSRSEHHRLHLKICQLFQQKSSRGSAQSQKFAKKNRFVDSNKNMFWEFRINATKCACICDASSNKFLFSAYRRSLPSSHRWLSPPTRRCSSLCSSRNLEQPMCQLEPCQARAPPELKLCSLAERRFQLLPKKRLINRQITLISYSLLPQGRRLANLCTGLCRIGSFLWL